jgi:hypothetical protein
VYFENNFSEDGIVRDYSLGITKSRNTCGAHLQPIKLEFSNPLEGFEFITIKFPKKEFGWFLFFTCLDLVIKYCL